MGIYIKPVFPLPPALFLSYPLQLYATKLKYYNYPEYVPSKK